MRLFMLESDDLYTQTAIQILLVEGGLVEVGFVTADLDKQIEPWKVEYNEPREFVVTNIFGNDEHATVEVKDA